MDENGKRETILVIDFGGQYNQLIARRVRECGVYAEVLPYSTPTDEILAREPKGLIFTGGPNSVYGESALAYDPRLLETGVPTLGICYGAQLMAHGLGGQVKTAPTSEYGHADVKIDAAGSRLMAGVPEDTVAWMSHTDYIAEVPEDFRITARTGVCPVAAMECPEKGLYATQFHPEVMHTVYGRQILRNFVMDICGCAGDWKMDSFVDSTIKAIREKVGDGKALCALSGGVDSSVAAVLMSKAIGRQLTCVFVDHGLLRKNESEEVSAVFGPDGPYELNFIRVDAGERFYEKLAGVTEPEKKRKIIGEEFIRVFEEEAKKIGAVDFLVQGTIYPDVIESGLGDSATIKSHHNVGGLPDYVDFKEIIEPLRMLFKDEVRQAGRELGIPEHLVSRQPFPGPGLAIRIIGEVTPEKLKIVREADAIFREEIDRYSAEQAKRREERAAAAAERGAAGTDAGTPAADAADQGSGTAAAAIYEPTLKESLGQYFAALTNMRSVGVMGDFRTYDYAVALRAVSTDDFMTASAATIPWELLGHITTRIVNEVDHVSRVLYDCTSKPPATIELE